MKEKASRIMVPVSVQAVRGNRFRLLFWGSALSLLLFYALELGLIHAWNPNYLKDFHQAVNPDAVTYVQLGQNLWQRGEYSRNPNPPYLPDFKWTPVFPFLAGAMSALGGVSAILVMNVLLTLSGAFLLARLAFRMTRSRKISFLLFIFLALDPLVWSVNLQAMSDAAFLFFLILGAYWTVPALFLETSFSWKHFACMVLGGLAFSLGTLTRPTGLYVPWIFWIAICGAFGWKFFQTFRHRENFAWSWFNRQLSLMMVFLAAALLPVSLWMLRNWEVFGKMALCSNQNLVMVYYTGGGAWQTELGCSLEEAQTRIQREFHLPPNYVCQNPEAFGVDQTRIDDQLEACRGKVLTRYPKSLFISSCRGVLKSLLAHETRTLLAISRGPNAPGPNDSIWGSWVFVWSLLFQGTLLGLTVWTLLFSLRDLRVFAARNPALALALVGWAAYFLLTMMLSGVDCCARYRLPLMPIFYLCAAWRLSKMAPLGSSEGKL